MKLDAKDVKQSARGQWLSIVNSLGISIPIPPGRHGPCPICSDHGKDRFRLDSDTSDLKWFCNQCTPQAGDGISLVMRSLGLTFAETLEKISGVIGLASQDGSRKESEYDKREALNRLWKSSKKLQGNDQVLKYLHSRGLVLTPEYVRFCPECFESDTKTRMPAMVAKFVGPDGKALTLHRTYLNGNGKADIKSPKKLMPGTAPLIGGAIRLFPPVDKTIGVSEGIETAIAATQVFQTPCWAVVSSSLMKGFVPPDGVRRVVVFGDNDPHFVGQEAAYCLARRLFTAGLVVEVQLPETGKDFNDYLLQTRNR